MCASRCFSVILAAAAAFACAQNPPAPDTAADVQAVQAVSEREISSFAAGDIEAAMAVFAPDAHVMPPNEPAVVGHDALRTWAQGMLDTFTLAGSYTSSDVIVAGDYAIERYTGRISLTPKAGGAAAEEAVKGIHIHQRQADGSWKIIQDVWNSDAPPPPPPPTTTTTD